LSITVKNKSLRQSPSKSIKLLEWGCDKVAFGSYLEIHPSVSSVTSIDF